MDNKKGLSAVVATLIIILLVLVAVGILWVVIRGVIQGGADTIELSQKCLDIQLEASAVVPVTSESGNYSVTLARKAGGDTLGGVKLNFFNATENSGVIEFGTALGILETGTNKIVTADGGNGILHNATRMDFTTYFVSDLGEEQVCSSTETAPLA
ncbi:MAG: hypothetical protein KJ879_01565 [Nanoarchaeota archaeon]|nr:hypothetical protein [Nanoarchaeota archaeon]